MKNILFIAFLCSGLRVFAQEYTEGHISQQFDQAIELINQGQYARADEELRSVMSKMDALPSNVAYYFGRNSFHLEKYKQSINWLNKYIQLKGTQGQHYNEAVKYLQLAEEEYLKISRSQPVDLATELSGSDYDCGGLEKMICPVCHGDGVIIKKGLFDNVYQTCPYSKGASFLSCENYNLFMRGLLDPAED